MAKGTNNINLYGEELNTYPTWTNTSKGLGFSDSIWSAGTQGNSGIRKTGVVPNTAVSTIALNTALKQASVGARIIGELLSADVVGLQQNVESDDLTKVPNYVSALTAYLAKIQGLISGSQKAHTAINYDTGAGGIKNKFDNIDNSINTINSQLSTLTNTTIPNTINTLKTNIENGTVVANKATYYTDGGNTTIATKINELNTRLTSLQFLTATITIKNSTYISTGGVGYQQGKISVLQLPLKCVYDGTTFSNRIIAEIQGIAHPNTDFYLGQLIAGVRSGGSYQYTVWDCKFYWKTDNKIYATQSMRSITGSATARLTGTFLGVVNNNNEHPSQYAGGGV